MWRPVLARLRDLWRVRAFLWRRAGADRSHLDRTALLCVAISASVLATTIHAQDFKDVDGDRAVGRQTLPIVFPHLSRRTMVVGVLAWSIALACIWQLDVLTAALFLALGATVGLRFALYTSVREDQMSYVLYNVRPPAVLAVRDAQADVSDRTGVGFVCTCFARILEACRVAY